MLLAIEMILAGRFTIAVIDKVESWRRFFKWNQLNFIYTLKHHKRLLQCVIFFSINHVLSSTPVQTLGTWHLIKLNISVNRRPAVNSVNKFRLHGCGVAVTDYELKNLSNSLIPISPINLHRINASPHTSPLRHCRPP